MASFLVFVLIFFLGPECADLYPAHAYLLVAFPPSFFSVLYFEAHSICPLLLSPPLSVLLPRLNNPPAGRSTSYRHAPSSLALALASAPPTPLLFHARATATTATRGCASSWRAVAGEKAPQEHQRETRRHMSYGCDAVR